MTEDEANRERQRLARAAVEKLAQLGLNSCPRCDRMAGWDVDVTGIVTVRYPMPDPGGFPIPPPYLPSVILVCKFCSFTSIHNLKTLGLVK